MYNYSVKKQKSTDRKAWLWHPWRLSYGKKTQKHKKTNTSKANQSIPMETEQQAMSERTWRNKDESEMKNIPSNVIKRALCSTLKGFSSVHRFIKFVQPHSVWKEPHVKCSCAHMCSLLLIKTALHPGATLKPLSSRKTNCTKWV